MEIKRIASNEEFIRKIILSIDKDYYNYRNNRQYFYKFFTDKLSDTGNAVEAIEYAKDKLQKLVEKRNIPSTQKVKKTKPAEQVKTVEKDKEPSLRDLSEEQMDLTRQRKENRREEIRSLIKAKSGFEDEEVLKYLYRAFILHKRSNNFPDDRTVDKIIQNYIIKVAKEASPEIPPAPPTEEDLRKAARIIEYLDPKNVGLNLQRFKYYLDSHTIEKAFQFTQDFIKYRQFLRENNLPPNKVNSKIFDEYGQDYDKAVEIIKKRQQEGKMPLESKVLSKTKGETSESNYHMVNFDGQNVPLLRVLQKLYPNLHYARLKKYYSTIQSLIFNFGYSLDEALDYNRREDKVFSNREFFRQNFPVDPDQAEKIFEGYFVEDGLTFEESLEKTKQDIYGNRLTTAQKKYRIRIK